MTQTFNSLAWTHAGNEINFRVSAGDQLRYTLVVVDAPQGKYNIYIDGDGHSVATIPYIQGVVIDFTAQIAEVGNYPYLIMCNGETVLSGAIDVVADAVEPEGWLV